MASIKGTIVAQSFLLENKDMERKVVNVVQLLDDDQALQIISPLAEFSMGDEVTVLVTKGTPT